MAQIWSEINALLALFLCAVNKDLAQGAVDEALVEIEHGTDCRLRLLQQNLQNHVRAALVFGAHL